MTTPMRNLGALALLALLALFAPALAAQAALEPQPFTPPALRAGLAFHPESRLWVEGTSTVRDYKCEAATIAGAVELEAADASLALADLDATVRGVTLSIPVAQLDCRNGTMNGHMRKALKAEEHAEITYRLAAHEVEVQANGDALATLEGELTIAGTTRPITLGAIVTAAPDGALKVQGSTELDMTEYGVKPPKLMLGTLKVNPRVTVHFDVLLRR